MTEERRKAVFLAWLRGSCRGVVEALHSRLKVLKSNFVRNASATYARNQPRRRERNLANSVRQGLVHQLAKVQAPDNVTELTGPIPSCQLGRYDGSGGRASHVLPFATELLLGYQ